jgi:hemolysin III
MKRFTSLKDLHDPFSSLSHAVGALLSIAGLVLLLCWSGNDPWRIVSFAVYGSTLVLQFVASALYHALRRHPRLGDILYSLDRSAIYTLIAGTYTPICLVALGGAWGWSLFGVVWGFALVGIIVDILLKRKTPHWLQAVLYLITGWVFLVGIVPLLRVLTLPMLLWLALGVALYSGGAVLCVKYPRPRRGRLHFHDLWHVCVLGASACHFVVMFLLSQK